MNRKVVEESELPAEEPTVKQAGWHFTTQSYLAGRVKPEPKDYITVRGRDLRMGDDLTFLSSIHRIFGFTPYDPTRIGLPAEDGWRIADCPAGWGMTIDPGGLYRIHPRPIELRKNIAPWF
ncbi:hypothetical protein ACLMAJ_28320 [Nocardia sp. KC 131]|uniref:hypothetical protein n=1 Tax=Nocardia arseniciresistens TaxID=3392119 RepID=UPI00398F0713